MGILQIRGFRINAASLTHAGTVSLPCAQRVAADIAALPHDRHI
jgi:hypothetical protein